jgi:hypothetical protein
MIKFGIIGAGWRAEFFLRIVQALPDVFEVTGVVTRNAERAARMHSVFNTRVLDSVDALAASNPSFVVTSVSYAANADVLIDVAGRGLAVLAETPPAGTPDGLLRVWDALKHARVQVAEQYHLRPIHAARIAFAHSGKLGALSQAQISVAHGYHGTSLIRRYLGIGYEDATITAMRFKSPIIDGPGRSGPPDVEKIKEASQDIAWLNFGDKLGVFDFSGEQYFNYARNNRVLVRGDRGEIVDDRATYLQDARTPIEVRFIRREVGHADNLEHAGPRLHGILAGESWVYRNPLPPAPLSDDEVAIAHCLLKMQHYVETGESFYSLAEASQDTYLGFMVNKAIETGNAIRTERQRWESRD